MTDESLDQRRYEKLRIECQRLEQRIMALPKSSAEREPLMRQLEKKALDQLRSMAQLLGVEQR